MRGFLAPMFWRYSGLAIQFLIVILVARTVDLTTAGEYFAIFGAVTVSYILSGAGVPDALVKMIPALRQGISSPGAMIRVGITGSSIVNAGVALAFASVCLALTGDLLVSMLVGGWWLAYAQVFALSQALLAAGASAWGVFGAYSSVNFGYLLTLVPYLVFGSEHTLVGMIVWACVGALIALVCLTVVGARTFGQSGVAHGHHFLAIQVWGGDFPRLVRIGFPLAISRLLQGMLPWLPVWVLTATGDAEGAAIYAAASRLTVVVTAILGSIRFGSRPEIVTLASDQSWETLAALSRRASYTSAAGALLAFVVMSLLGTQVVRLLLGAEYVGASSVVLILLVGIVAEAIGGLSDEILKMTGMARVVLATLFIAAGAQAILLVLLPDLNPSTAAWTTVTAFAVQYILQVAWLRFVGPVSIWPAILGKWGTREP